jgi:hypothetical protein
MDPISTHGYIVLAGFLPMFIASGFGVEMPMIGFPELDTTYESTSFMKMMMLMMAALMTGAALSEIRSEMSLKTFVQYHWVLSAGLAVWQLGGSATTMGKMMFALPHVFTAWSTALLLSTDSSKGTSMGCVCGDACQCGPDCKCPPAGTDSSKETAMGCVCGDACQCGPDCKCPPAGSDKKKN